MHDGIVPLVPIITIIGWRTCVAEPLQPHSQHDQQQDQLKANKDMAAAVLGVQLHKAGGAVGEPTARGDVAAGHK